MSTSKRTLTAAFEAGDLQAALAACRQDIVFQTPILATVGDEVRGLTTLAKILRTAFICLGMPQNVEEFQNPAGTSSHSMVPSTAI
jgi:trans-aconitate methyltransferase